MCGIFVYLILGFIVSLVSSFRYNSLATLAVAAFGCVRALRAHCGPFGPAGWVPTFALEGRTRPKCYQYQLATRVNGMWLVDLESAY